MNGRKIIALTFGLLSSILLLAAPSSAQAAFSSGSTGADGALSPTASIVLQIPESGVFNYTTVNIPYGAIVTFSKNSANTPVTILATGDVTIGGTIDVSGSIGTQLIPGKGGPGGFEGGRGGALGSASGRGQGIGGGEPGTSDGTANGYAGGGGGGSFWIAGNAGSTNNTSFPGGAGGSTYGNLTLLPLLGGSGGGAGGSNISYVGPAGGGGGGAILIASSGTINVAGQIFAKGGNGTSSYIMYGGGGSGGAIRLIANTISGNGTISAVGGYASGSAGKGGDGRVRLETFTMTRTATTTPVYSFALPTSVTPPNMPVLSITKVGGIAVPAVPSGTYGSLDVTLPFNTVNPVSIEISGANIPVGTTVTAVVAPEVGAVTTATGTLSGTDAASTAAVQLTLSKAYPSIISISTTFVLTASNGAPFYVNGEKVERVRVSSVMGGGSSVIYITESGKEIPAGV
ncbi:MAG: hypothetical protein HZB85_00825 [Deltaproteobacteria bacterium]|nr:hypothetical protein [Deltaproteobacteria bacterium]